MTVLNKLTKSTEIPTKTGQVANGLRPEVTS